MNLARHHARRIASLSRISGPRPGTILLAAVLSLSFAPPVRAQASDAGSAASRPGPDDAALLVLGRLPAPIALDGRPDEDAWLSVPALPLTMYLPVFGGAATQRTEIRVAYDDANLYVAGRFFDDDPAGIRINSLYRDRWNGDDALAVYIDAFNDNRTSKWFGVTPAGVRFDQLVSDDGKTLNESWDGFWDAKAVVDSTGWPVLRSSRCTSLAHSQSRSSPTCSSCSATG